MKKLLLSMCIICTMLFGCKSSDQQTESVVVQFNVYGLEVTQSGIGPNLAPMDEQKAPTHLTIFEGTSEQPLYIGTSFTPEVKLSRGQHTLTFIATYQDHPAYTNGVWTADKQADTFGAVLSINTETIASEVDVELTRANYALCWNPTNTVNEDGLTATITVEPFRSTLTAGLTGGTTYTKTFDNIALKKGNISLTLNGYCGQFGVEEAVTTTLTIYQGNTQLASATIDAPVLSNRQTTITGNILNSTKTNKVTINYEWLQEKTVTLPTTED